MMIATALLADRRGLADLCHSQATIAEVLMVDALYGEARR